MTETLMTEAATTNEGSTNQEAATETTSPNTEVKTEAGTKGTEQESSKTDEATDEQVTPKGAPEKYEFTVPEGFQKDGILTELESVAKEANLPQDQAQKFVDLGVKMQREMVAKQQESIKTLHESWTNLSKTDKEFGGDKLESNMAIAKKGFEAIATPELKELLNVTGLGNHPEIIRAFYKTGLKISNDTHVNAGSGNETTKKSAASALYPNQIQS
jgi:hypothetical protein